MTVERQRVFISYSHEDVGWLQRLRTILAPLVGADRLEVWDDQGIAPGSRWRDEIDKALNQADVAVLLVSEAFLASDFIREFELPAILSRWRAGSMGVVWVAVAPASYEETALGDIQAANDPARPLSQLDESEVDGELVRIARLVAAGSATTAVGRVLTTVDKVTYQLAEMTGAPTREGRPPSVTAAPVNGTVELHYTPSPGSAPLVIETITAEDLTRLSDRQRRLIETFEASMYNEFDRWTDLYPRRSVLTDRERTAMASSAMQMCEDLTQIIAFLESLGKNLTDHYGEVRFICDQVAQLDSAS